MFFEKVYVSVRAAFVSQMTRQIGFVRGVNVVGHVVRIRDG